jgi:hypothetical protein
MKKFEKYERRGLPGGPNEIASYMTGAISTQGYKSNSPDKYNDFNIILSNNITTKGVDFPLFGMDNLGNTAVMMPGANYKFPGDMVFEMPMAQRGLEKYQTKGELTDYGFGAFGEVLPNEVLTMANAPAFFNNQAVYYRDDSVPVETEQRYNDMIREKVYAGTHGYNPATKQLVVLDNKKSLLGSVIPAIDVDPVTQVQSTREYADVIENSYQPMFDDRVYDYIETLPADQREAMEDYYKNDLVRGWVASNNAAAFRNPIMYAPGLAYTMGVLGPAYGPAISSTAGTYASAPLTVGSYVNPYITAGNLLNAGFAADFLVNRAPKIPGLMQEGNYGEAALDGGLGALDLAGAYTLPIRAGSALGRLFRRGKSLIKPNKSFKSEIDWGKWNEEIPLNKELMQEYHTIEEVAKAKGTWMKNPDGSPFEGLPEQWVQQNSANYQKAFPNALRNEAGNIQISYHGSPNKFDAFDESKFYSGQYGVGVYTSPDKEGVLRTYANPSGKRSKKMAQITTGEEPTSNLYELYINTNKPGNLDDLYFEEEYFGNIRDFGKTSDDLPTLEEWKKSDKGKRILENSSYLKTDEDILSFLRQHADFKNNVKENFRPVLPDYDFISVPSSRLKEQVTPFSNRLKSAVGNNGMFDMTNPSMYKQRGGGLTKYVGETDQGGYRVGVDVDRGDRQRSKSFSLEPSGDTSYSRSVTTPKGSRNKSIDIVDGEATKTITRTRNGETIERTKTLSDRKADRLSKKYARKVNSVFTDPFPEVPNPNEGKFTIEYEQGGEAAAPDFGSYGLNIEDTLLFPRYINYMNGNDESIEARRVYDKLNRKVYRYAKQGGMTAPNYMMTEVLRLGGSV